MRSQERVRTHFSPCGGAPALLGCTRCCTRACAVCAAQPPDQRSRCRLKERKWVAALVAHPGHALLAAGPVVPLALPHRRAAERGCGGGDRGSDAHRSGGGRRGRVCVGRCEPRPPPFPGRAPSSCWRGGPSLALAAAGGEWQRCLEGRTPLPSGTRRHARLCRSLTECVRRGTRSRQSMSGTAPTPSASGCWTTRATR